LKLDEEEHVDSAQRDGLDGEEVAGEHGRGLTADELAPGQPTSLSRRAEPGLAQELSPVVTDTVIPSPASSPAIR
jgi:hypothetical protein